MKIKSYLLGAVALCALQSVAVSARAEDQNAIMQRLDKLESENSALRQQLNRVETRHGAPARSVAAAPAEVASQPDPQAGLQNKYSGPMPPAGYGKAPVQFVRVCGLYGEGFYYIPGTDACIKVGGYVRLQAAVGASGDGIVVGADSMAGQGRLNRFNTNDANYDARAVASIDVRGQTGLGTVRGYVRFGAEANSPTVAAGTPTMFWDRGYIQFVGFTVGKQRSFFDMFEPVSTYTYGNPRTTGDTDLTGAIMAGYTWWAGAGVSFSVAAEDPGAHEIGGVTNLGNATAANQLGLGVLGTNNGLAGQVNNTLHGFQVPDAIVNARLDQAWGYAAVSGALHKVAGDYYGVGGAGAAVNGHPADTWGYAASVALKVFVPTGPGDWIGGNFVFSQGAPGYATKGAVWQLYNGSSGSNGAGFAWLPDGVYDNTGLAAPGSSIERTTAWSFNGAFQHVWDPMWKTSVYGGFTKADFDQTATNFINQHSSGPAGGLVCGVTRVAPVGSPALGLGSGAGNSCSPSFSFWQVGSRTQWNPRPWLDLGMDVFYTRLNTAYAGSNVSLAANGANPAGGYNITNQNVISVLGRAQFSFDVGQ